MPAKTRLLGQDVQIRISRNGILTTLTAIKSFTFETRVRRLAEGYLGETTNRQDEIADEVGGSFTIHIESNDAFVFQKFLFDRAQARTADEDQVSLVFRTTFPSGEVTRITIPNPAFESVPVNVGGRDTYVDQTYTYGSSAFTHNPAS